MKKQFRVQIDFTIEANEEKIQVDPHITWTTPPDEAWIHARLERQRNLFRAVLSQPEILQRYLEYLISVEFETTDTHMWSQVFGLSDHEFEDTLTPVIATLNNPDKKWFTEALEEQVLFDNTEEFQGGFSVSWDELTLTEIQHNITSGK